MALGLFTPLPLHWIWTFTALIFKLELALGQFRMSCSISCVCYHPHRKANSGSENKEGKSWESMKKFLWQQGPCLWKAFHDKTWGFLCFYPNMPKSTRHTSVKIQAWKTARCAGNQGKFLRHLLTWKQWYGADALLERRNAFHLFAKKFGVLTVPLEKSSSTCWNLFW